MRPRGRAQSLYDGLVVLLDENLGLRRRGRRGHTALLEEGVHPETVALQQRRLHAEARVQTCITPQPAVVYRHQCLKGAVPFNLRIQLQQRVHGEMPRCNSFNLTISGSELNLLDDIHIQQ
ncbi:Thymidine phosphorylase [Phytophthora palmivora]|uniref:Thymidine phosphorylase n=1 Tax=Phytophthora palmivora TaxID=4796 RepID=A0A2P4X2Z5_9STRA|nr:Thymidine phosphorylase [Phytophthora palmivora]